MSVGVPYRLANTKGQSEWIQLRSVGTGAAPITCDTDQPLEYSYATSDTLSDPRVTFAITAGQFPDVTYVGRNYRVRFDATIGSRHEYVDILFDVVAHLSAQPVTAANLRSWDPGLHRLLPTECRGTNWGEQLAIAWESVKSDLGDYGLRPGTVMDDGKLARLQLLRFKELLSEDGRRLVDGSSPLEAARYFHDAYVDEQVKVCKSLDLWVDKNRNLAPDAGEARQPGTELLW